MILAYGVVSLLTTVSFLHVHSRYYAGPIQSNSTGLYVLALVVGSFWPMGLPVFLYHYSEPIKGVLSGRDWADDHILDDTFKEFFRENEEEAHRQVQRESALRKQETEKTERSPFN